MTVPLTRVPLRTVDDPILEPGVEAGCNQPPCRLFTWSSQRLFIGHGQTTKDTRYTLSFSAEECRTILPDELNRIINRWVETLHSL